MGLANLHVRLLCPTRPQFWHLYLWRSLPGWGGTTVVTTLEGVGPTLCTADPPLWSGVAVASDGVCVAIVTPMFWVGDEAALWPTCASTGLDTEGGSGVGCWLLTEFGRRIGGGCGCCGSSTMGTGGWTDWTAWGGGTAPKSTTTGTLAGPLLKILLEGCSTQSYGIKFTQICNAHSPLEMHCCTTPLNRPSLWTLITRPSQGGATVGLKIWLRGEYALRKAEAAKLHRYRIWNRVGRSVWTTILAPMYSRTNVKWRMGGWLRFGWISGCGCGYGCICCPCKDVRFTAWWVMPDKGLKGSWCSIGGLKVGGFNRVGV